MGRIMWRCWPRELVQGGHLMLPKGISSDSMLLPCGRFSYRRKVVSSPLWMMEKSCKIITIITWGASCLLQHCLEKWWKPAIFGPRTHFFSICWHFIYMHGYCISKASCFLTQDICADRQCLWSVNIILIECTINIPTQQYVFTL